MDNMLMGQNAQPPQPDAAPPAAGGPQQPAQPSPADIAGARAHAKVVMNALMGLAAKPKGSLSKEDVYGAAADMIAGGAFGTPQAKQMLVAQLAQMPDDEAGIRQVVGQQLMGLAHAQEAIHHHFGPGDDDA